MSVERGGKRWLLIPALLAGTAWASTETAGNDLAKQAYATARSEYERLLMASPDDTRLAYNAGVAAFRQQDLEGAARHFESALGARDLSLQQRAYFNLGNTRFRQGEAASEPADKQRLWTDAARKYEASLGLNSSDLDAQANLDVVQQQLAALPKPPPQADEGKNKPDQNKDSSKDGKKGGANQDPAQSKDPSDQSNEGKGKDDKDEEGRKPQTGKEGDQPGQSKDNPKFAPQQGKGDDRSGESGKSHGSKEAPEGGTKAGQKGDPKDGPEGAPGEGRTAGGGAEPPPGQMEVRFAERLLDGHKSEERALIWRPAGSNREHAESSGRRKTW